MKRKIFKNVQRNITAVEINAFNTVEINDYQDNVDTESHIDDESTYNNKNNPFESTIKDDLDEDNDLKFKKDTILGLKDNLLGNLQDNQITAINHVVKDIRCRLLGKKT